ncbi:MAG: hypothetical protein ACTS7I_02480, partial [Candidatus Hodgkinia cicadicola]
NIYVDDKIKTWKGTAPQGIRINDKKTLNTLIFAAVQMIIISSEDGLQRSLHRLYNVSKGYTSNCDILSKTKVIAFVETSLEKIKFV